MKKNRCFALFFFLLVVDGYAQQSKIDSLLSILKTVQYDTNRLNCLNRLSNEYDNIGVYDSAKSYADLALQLSANIRRETKNTQIIRKTQRSDAKSYIYKGNVGFDQGNYSEALKNYEQALKGSEEIHYQEGMAHAYNNIGLANQEQGNYPESLKNYFASLKIREAMNDNLGVSVAYGNIGNVYEYQHNYTEALKYFCAELKISTIVGDQHSIAASYNGIGNVYINQGNYEEALKNYLKCLEIMESINDQQSISVIYNNIGMVYSAQNNYSEALKSYFASLKIGEVMNDRIGIADCYSNIGHVFTQERKYTEAKRYLDKAKKIAEEIGDKFGLVNVYANLTSLDSVIGDFKGAYENHKLSIIYRDSLDNEETRKKTIQNQMSFDFEKREAVAGVEHQKELENQQLLAEEKSRKQKVVLFLVIGCLLLVLMFSVFVLKSLRTTNKQKQIIEMQKKLVEEKQKEIIDSIFYAGRIQRSLLPTEKYIDKSLIRLKKNE